MKQALLRTLRVMHAVEDAFLVSLLLGMVLLAVLQIVLRNGFHGGLLWVDPLSRILVLWIALCGALVASRERRHVNIDVISRFLPLSAKRYVTALTALFTAVVCGVLAWYTLDFVRIEHESPTSAFASVPTWVCELVMPFGFSLMSLRYFLNALRSLIWADIEPAHSVENAL